MLYISATIDALSVNSHPSKKSKGTAGWVSSRPLSMDALQTFHAIRHSNTDPHRSFLPAEATMKSAAAMEPAAKAGHKPGRRTRLEAAAAK